MKMKWIVGTVASVVLAAAGLQAQNADSKDAQQSTITVTGCLQPGADRGAVGTSGSNARAAGQGTAGSASGATGPLMLVNAIVGGAPGGGSGVTSVAPPGSGTTESAARAGSSSPSPAIAGAIDKNGNADKSATGVYLIRTDNPEVSRHVGQEVELSGRIVPAGTTAGANGAASSSAGTASTVGSTGAGTSTTAPQTLEVRTVRMIASVCAAR